jgi:hypothetical protein
MFGNDKTARLGNVGECAMTHGLKVQQYQQSMQLDIDPMSNKAT